MFAVNRRGFVVAALAAGLLAGAAGGVLAQDRPKIEFLYSPYADYAPFFLAEDLGYFDEFGVDVTLSPKSGTAETIQMLASGNVQAGAATWGAGLFNSINAGATVAIVATSAKMPATVPSPSPFMVSQKAWDEGVKTVADLKGKRVGIPGPGGFGMYSVAKALEKGGLTVEDVEAIYLPPPATAAAFANGGLEAGWSIEPFALQLEREGLGRRLVEDHTFGTELGFIAFNKEFVESHEDAVVNFLAAYLKAARQLDNGGWKDEKVLDIVARYTGTEKSLLQGITYTIRSEDGSIDLNSVREQEAFFRKRGDLEYKGDVDINSVYRSDLLKRANELVAKK
ncbi:ABC-type nitrate/sulfonate/bicarbonate transport system substrate-binding protein [Aminobacter aminovorans]|uniref:Sulfate starvation-induced protein 1 n=1 Tax=Aminobacter aminovorans TaxID=83263 RepID=A0A380WHM8_AMIAI|nr:ABC transporter substrate-binding protein [Aminobacter aminovorans]TCS28576.1 ABC-type nitrate/sulfonate/bicarbonate transport system substrate-binding protein [Aminobacter aminovorans]SUU88430.1 Sulfate starvation-induced protein 1 [Aminobacter aminovorans]